VIRVLTRLGAISGDIDVAATKATLWRLAEEAIPAGDACDFNQAMMELGATICSPAAPRCGQCPVHAQCAAFAEGAPTDYPVRAKRTAWVSVTDCAGAIERGGKLLIVKRPEHGLWGGLWELPRATLQEGESPEQCAARAVAEWVGMPMRVGAGFATWKHTVMNRKMTLLGFHASVAEDAQPALVRAVDFAWVTPEDVLSYPLSSPQKGLIGLYGEAVGQGSLGI
jgi:A/G-specific adenine glycosylase